MSKDVSSTLLVGISGPSSSGKTTLSRLLRDALNSSSRVRAFILHEDDFYKTDAEIPVNDEGVQDWDCLESINLPLLQRTLAYVRDNGKLPEDFKSKEDQNDVGKVDVDQSVIDTCKKHAQTVSEKLQTAGRDVTVAIIDGFLLFADAMADIRSLFDVKLFLRTSYATAKQRREARSGYVTLEGFWADPPGYVDKVVWPNYVKDHSFLFEGGDVAGEFDEAILTRLSIIGMPRDAEGNMTRCFEWAFIYLLPAIEGQLSSSSS